MRLALSTVCLSGTLRDKLEAAAAARFDAVELSEPDFIGFRGTAREVRQIAEDLGIGIDLYQPKPGLGGGVEVPLQQALDRTERTFDLMVQLGVPMLSVTPMTLPLALQQPALAVEQLQRLTERATERNLRLAFAPAPDHQAVRNLQDAWAIVDAANHPHLGLLIDSVHTLTSPDDPAGIRDIPGNRIFFVRVDDARRVAGDGRSAGWVRNFPGQGELKVADFLEHVLFTGYAGPLSLARGRDEQRATPGRRTSIDARRSLLYLENQLRDRLEQAGAGTTGAAAAGRILNTVSLFDPPEPSPLNGFAFIEVGVRDDAGVRLGARLQQLGFTRYGRHRTKAVTLYRQGEIRVAVNAEAESEALGGGSRPLAYVSSLGLLAEHAGRATSRAGALLSARRDTPRGAQELELPTIVAPGGTMIQFLAYDQPAETDFIEDPSGSVTACGLDVVDHVSMALTPDQRDTWLLFARAVLGLTPGEIADAPEPFGVIRGLGLANHNRRVRLLLTVPTAASAGPRGTSDSGRFGGHVEGIALGCTDIFATVERLRDNGVFFVPISGNYYDDLAGRTTLDATVIERMRELQILFDSSSAGTYFHAYTEAFEDRFHFQIVQRTGYDGFGAANEPIRSAALAQQRQLEAWLQPRL
jgi:4-hydroxyphenylpyruvate dioxygenase